MRGSLCIVLKNWISTLITLQDWVENIDLCHQYLSSKSTRNWDDGFVYSVKLLLCLLSMFYMHYPYNSLLCVTIVALDQTLTQGYH